MLVDPFIPITNLRQALHCERLLWGFCRECSYSRLISPAKLLRTLNENTPLGEAAKKLRCSRCGGWQCALIPSLRTDNSPEGAMAFTQEDRTLQRPEEKPPAHRFIRQRDKNL